MEGNELAKLHKLKTVQPYYNDILFGRKRFEVRKNDRDFKVGDQLRLLEYDAENQRFTGMGLTMMNIIYVLDNPEFCKEGFAIIGFEPQHDLKSHKMARVAK